MNKVAVVTGASKGIGAATAIAFGQRGYDVVVNYLTDQNAALETARLCEAAGVKALAMQADVFTEQGVSTLFSFVEKEFGRIDVLVNNASLPKEAAFGEYTFDSVAQSVAGNFTSAVLCAQTAIPLMAAGGSILFTSSIYGLNFGGNPGVALYSAGKAAMINFAQTLAEKLAPSIRCNVVAPGTTQTPNWEGVDPEYVAKSLGMTLLKEWVTAEEIANTFVFLAETPHITGQTIVVDGGWQKKVRETSGRRK